ncbi:glycosyltransferase family 2 protein [Acetobacter senegalensis]|uniref:glycosyltransferase family 2 protein n=1 Tax=Acetobacter senegalensis TaxID=446692 RepID=UPI002656C344|nr:glycosyltransferase family 2 protein [Acetobacter senegalensis]MDN7352604.1 glycosyltransferase family 2 protein [Acetobacter senegalensis]
MNIPSAENKVAIVLFVKNEAVDIHGWIAWHLSSGFDSLIIYEDSSSDATGDVIDAAASHYDVRRQSVPESFHFQHRQQGVYLHAVETLRAEFDWIGFIDADEYVYFPNHPSASDFFAQFDDSVGAVALNWCCYGDSGHLLRPGPNVPEQFEFHSLPDYFENTTVKSFVRAKKMALTYHDPHRFEVDGRTVNAFGHDVIWDEKAHHRTADAPDWSNGSIRHYAIRSVEHYIEKVKRRSDIRSSADMGFFTWLNKNDIHSIMPRARLDGMNAIMYRLQHTISVENLSRFKKAFIGVQNNNIKYEPVFIKTHLGTRAYASRKTGTLVHAAPDSVQSDDYVPIILCLPDRTDAPAYIGCFLEKNPVAVYIFGEHNISQSIPLEMVRREGNSLYLRSFTRRRFLTFFSYHLEGGDVCGAKIVGDWPQEWEHIVGERLPEPLNANAFLAHWLHRMELASDFRNIANSHDHTDAWADLLSARLSTLDRRTRTQFIIKHNLQELPWLGDTSGISF